MTLIQCPECESRIEADTADGSTLQCSSCGAEIDRALTVGKNADERPDRNRPATPVETEAGGQARPSTTSARIGHYRLTQGLGRGSFGEVWKAFDENLDRVVAIKVPRRGMLSKAQLSSFLREARAIAKLNHPGIVGVYEVGQTGNGPFIVTEFIDGHDLKHHLRKRSLTIEEAVQLCVAVGEAIGHAHQHGVVHRDLKPANIMMDRAGRPHVMDFGLAKRVTDVDVKQTVDGQVMGTPAYMSPEQARGDSRHVDGRSDVYSLGVILFELLTGELPFRGRAAMLLRQVIEEEPPAPRTLNGAIPPDLQNICLKCLEKNPDHRYQSADDYVADLTAFLNHRPVSARPTTRLQRFNKWCHRNPVIASLTSLAFSFLLALFVVSLLFLVRERRLRNTVQEAYEREASALQQAKQTAVDLKRQRDGLEAAQAIIASTQNRVNEQSRSYAARLYSHTIRDCDRWIQEGEPLRARQALDELAEGDPQREFLCWAWDYLDHQLRRRYNWFSTRRGRIERIACNRNGDELFVLFQGGAFERWLLEGAQLTQVATPAGVNNTVRDFDLDSVSGRLAIISSTSNLEVFTREGERIAFSDRESSKQTRVRLAPGGEHLAVLDENATFRILAVPSLREICTWSAKDQGVSTFAWSPDQSLLAVASGQRVEFRALSDGVEMNAADFPAHINCIDWTSDGQRLLAGGGWDAWLVDPKTAKIDRFAAGTFGTSAIIASVGGDDDGDTAWILNRAGRLTAWSPRQRRIIRDETIHEEEGTALCLSTSGNRLFAADASGRVLVWNLNEPPELEPKVLEHPRTVRRVDWHPDGHQLAAADWSGQFVVWDVGETDAKQRFSRQVCAPGHFCESAAWSPDGKRLATSSTDGNVTIWETTRGEKLSTLKGHRGAVYGIAWHPHEPRLASSGTGGVVRIWDTEALKEVESWEINSVVEQVAWSIDGKRLLAAGHFLSLRDMENHEVLFGEPLYGTSAFNVAVHPDQTRFAICTGSGKVSIGKLDDPSSRDDFRASQAELRGLTWSPHGKCLVTTDQLGKITLWQHETLSPLFSLPVRSRARAWCAAFSPDGKQLAVCNEAGNILLWNISQ